MKHISSQNIEKCLAVMDELCKYRTSLIYMNPVDPIRDNCPDYFTIISNPMDFSTVRLKLTSNSYATISEWKHDINLIFNNSKLYNSKDSLFGLTAQFLQKKFNDMVKYFSDDGWSKKFYILQEQIKNLVQNPPASLPNPYFTPEEIEIKRSQLFPTQNIFIKVGHKKGTISQSGFSSTIKKADQNNIEKNSNSIYFNNESTNINKRVISKKINISNQNNLKKDKQVSSNRTDNQSISVSDTAKNKLINDNESSQGIKKINLFDQNALHLSSNTRNRGVNINNYNNSSNSNFIDKSANNALCSFPNHNYVSTVSNKEKNNEVNENDHGNISIKISNQVRNDFNIISDSKHPVQKINYPRLSSNYGQKISNNEMITKIINRRENKYISNNSTIGPSSASNANTVNNFASNKNNTNNFSNRNRNNRNNNDSDSSDNIFILDD